MKKNACQMPISFLYVQRDLEKDNCHLLVLVLRRSGTLSVKTVHKENGTMWRNGQGDGVSKAWPQQAAADSRGSRTCMCAITYSAGWHMGEG